MEERGRSHRQHKHSSPSSYRSKEGLARNALNRSEAERLELDAEIRRLRQEGTRLGARMGAHQDQARWGEAEKGIARDARSSKCSKFTVAGVNSAARGAHQQQLPLRPRPPFSQMASPFLLNGAPPSPLPPPPHQVGRQAAPRGPGPARGRVGRTHGAVEGTAVGTQAGAVQGAGLGQYNVWDGVRIGGS